MGMMRLENGGELPAGREWNGTAGGFGQEAEGGDGGGAGGGRERARGQLSPLQAPGECPRLAPGNHIPGVSWSQETLKLTLLFLKSVRTGHQWQMSPPRRLKNSIAFFFF